MKITFPIIFILAVLTSCNLLGGSDNDDGPPRTIVFSAQDDDGIFQIYKMREDGIGIKQLTSGDYASIQPAWSPDGDRIAYARSFGSTAGEQLWVMDTDGSDKQSLITNSHTGSPQLGNNPAWSPDGSKVAFDRCLNCEQGGENHEIMLADLQAGTIDTLTENTVWDIQAVWSPNGSRLAFTSNRNNPDQSGDVYIFSLDTGEISRITNTGNAGRQIWSQKDKIIYWTNNHLYQVNLVNSTKKIIETDFPSEIGFRPLDITPEAENILLHTFNLKTTKEDQAIEKLNLTNTKPLPAKYSLNILKVPQSLNPLKP